MYTISITWRQSSVLVRSIYSFFFLSLLSFLPYLLGPFVLVQSKWRRFAKKVWKSKVLSHPCFSVPFVTSDSANAFNSNGFMHIWRRTLAATEVLYSFSNYFCILFQIMLSHSLTPSSLSLSLPLLYGYFIHLCFLTYNCYAFRLQSLDYIFYLLPPCCYCLHFFFPFFDRY